MQKRFIHMPPTNNGKIPRGLQNEVNTASATLLRHLPFTKNNQPPLYALVYCTKTSYKSLLASKIEAIHIPTDHVNPKGTYQLFGLVPDEGEVGIEGWVLGELVTGS